MTLDEKNNITYGSSDAVGCSGFTGSVPRLNFPGICLNDAENGVRTGSLVNAYPAEIHVGASWNRSLAYDRAYYLGKEFKAKGINVALGPVVGPLGRLATGGRNWEGFSNDPYLSGSLVSPTVEGIQQSVIACTKHLIANEQETNRQPFLAGIIPGLLTQAVSSNLDDRTIHELYLWPFYDAVKAGLGSIMCSYNRVNNSYSCQNSKVLNGLLKTELGFEGFVVSDWYAQHTGVASANAGLDMAMPNSVWFDNDQLATAVQNGSVNATRLDDMATRILATWYRYADFETPGMSNYATVDARDSAADAILFQSAVEGHVLVKNVNGALPLNKPKTLSLFGFDALGGLNSSTADSFTFDLGLSNTPNYTNGFPFGDVETALFMAEVMPAGTAGPQVAMGGTMLSAGGSGAVTATSSISPYDAFKQQAATDGTTLHTDFYSHDPTVPSTTDACIVFVNEQSSESWDRAGLADPYADELITNVASQCSNTIVVIHNAHIRLVDDWIENANITAVIFAHLPGQENGNSLVEVMYGRQSPSGRLPYTVAKSSSDYGDLLNPATPTLENPIFPQSDFSEGVYIDYKYFIQQSITPRFAFGYGLTYSNFSYSSLHISLNTSVSTSSLPPDASKYASPAAAPEGGLPSLYDIVATVTVDVTNIGEATAAEVAQLYVGIPNAGPPKVLRGFDKHLLQASASATYQFPLRRRDLSMWDITQQQWVLQSGTYQIMVGKSVLDIQLEGTLSL